MDKEEFIYHMGNLIDCARAANKASDIFGCNLEDGFIGDLISGYGTLILTKLMNIDEDEINDSEYASFWDAVYRNADKKYLFRLYDRIVAH